MAGTGESLTEGLNSSGNLGGYISERMARVYTEQELVGMVKGFVPKMTSSMRKGHCGRIGVVGGIQEYAGAPYFAAISALKVGADLLHIFCTVSAAPVIKSYSPELIVHPLLDKANAVAEISDWLPRMHALVVGPGLGRNRKLFETVKGIIQYASELNIPLVIDADGVYFVTNEPSMIKGNTKAILTPNFMEYSPMFEKVFARQLNKDNVEKSVRELAVALQGVTVVYKGPTDIISNGKVTVACSNEGSGRRCRGQGDVLSGSMGAFAYWAHLAIETEGAGEHPVMKNLGPSVAGAYAACFLTRECNRVAFAKHKRSMRASDMVACIGAVFHEHFEHEKCKL